MKRALLFNTPYNPDYPWRPKFFWDGCPKCFEHFDLNYKCDHCGAGHVDNKPKVRYEPVFNTWVVWDGVDFRNGYIRNPSLVVAYKLYSVLQTICREVYNEHK